MFVIKRSGQKVPMRYDSITDRNIELSKDLDIDVAYLSKMVIQSLKNSMTTTEIDELAAETAACARAEAPHAKCAWYRSWLNAPARGARAEPPSMPGFERLLHARAI